MSVRTAEEEAKGASMLRIARRASLLGLLIALFVQGNALAATVNVSMTNFIFTPKTASLVIGGTVHWTNDTTSPHTSTGDTPLSLWDSGSIPGAGTFDFVFTAGGQYKYHCTFHQTLGMTGTVSVKIKASPPSGPAGTKFKVTVATINAPAGFVYDIQRKDPAGGFMNWMLNVTAKTVQWDSTGFAPGTYSFRSRLHNTSNGATSSYSAAKAVMVT
jgi:plastocyanin